MLSAKHTGPDILNNNVFSSQDTTGVKSDHSNRESNEDSRGEWITKEKRRRLRSAPHLTQSISSLNDLKKACRDCNAEFTVGKSIQHWFCDHGLHIPARCQNCRDHRKQTAVENTKVAPPLTILQQPTATRQVSNQTSNASVVKPNIPINLPLSSSAETDPAKKDDDESTEYNDLNERNKNIEDPNLSQKPITGYIADTETGSDDNAEARKVFQHSARTSNQRSGAQTTSQDSKHPASSDRSDSSHADHNSITPVQNSAHLEYHDHSKDSKGPPTISSHSDDSSGFNESGSDISESSNPNSSELPRLEEDSSMSSIHGRFWDSQSENQESTALPQLTEWRTIKAPRRRRHLDYVLSHPNKEASADTWRWTVKQFGSPSPGCYTSDMAEFFYECFKTRNNGSSACSVGQGD